MLSMICACSSESWRGVLGHALLIVHAENTVHQQAVVSLAGDHGRAALAAFEDRLLVVQPQPAASLARAVTFVTGVSEDRLNIADKIDFTIRGENEWC